MRVKLLKELIIILFLAALLFVCLFYKVRVFYVSSGSMEPSIKKHSLVFVKGFSFDNYVFNKLGKILAFYDLENKRVVLHRAVSVGKGGIVTKGDANEYEDFKLLNSENIIGEVLFSVPITPLLFFQVLLNIFLFLAGALSGRFLVFLKYEIFSRHSVFDSLH